MTHQLGRILVCLVLALELAACVTPKAPDQAVFEAKTAYAAALTIAVQYRQLPSCALPMHPPLCSDPATLDRLRQADNAAAPALDAAEATVRNPTFGQSQLNDAVLAATNAAQAFAAIVQTLKVKP